MVIWHTRRLASRLARSERGATAVEYGLMLVLIAAVIVAVVTTVGQQTSSGFQDYVDKMP
jgi:pilus assembly protein Flp/PilA